MFKTNSEYQKKLLKRWAPILEKGAAIESVDKKLVLAQVLENTRKEFTKKNLFTEAAPTAVGNTIDNRAPAYTAPVQGQGVMTQNDYILPNVVMPMLRRIFPTLMAHELVGVQAMTGPTGLVMALRAVAANPERVGLPQGYEFGYGNRGRTNQSIFTGDTGANTKVDVDSTQSLQNKLYGDDLNDIGTFLNGVPYSGRGVPTGRGEGYATGTNGAAGPGGYATGWANSTSREAPLDPTFGHWRNNTYPQATIKFEKRIVAAETRKLGSEWTPEDAEDLEAQQGLDLETEMTNLINRPANQGVHALRSVEGEQGSRRFQARWSRPDGPYRRDAHVRDSRGERNLHQDPPWRRQLRPRFDDGLLLLAAARHVQARLRRQDDAKRPCFRDWRDDQGRSHQRWASAPRP